MKTDPLQKQGSFKEQSSFTAYNIAFRRTFSGIQLSNKIFDALEKLKGPMDPAQKESALKSPVGIPFFESRYRITDRLLAKSRIHNVAELAAGLSPRGILWSRNHEEGLFVEVDLDKESLLKAQVIQEVTGSTKALPRLLLQPGDVLDSEMFGELDECFNDDQVAFICEGLLRYVSPKDQHGLAENIRGFLGERGGIWITPDLEFLSDITGSPEMNAHYEARAQEWGIDVRPNLFKDMAHAISFFEDHAFKVEPHCHSGYIDDLASPRLLKLDRRAVENDLARRYTFVMST